MVAQNTLRTFKEKQVHKKIIFDVAIDFNKFQLIWFSKYISRHTVFIDNNLHVMGMSEIDKILHNTDSLTTY